MSDFPYKRFVLTPSFAVKEVEIASVSKFNSKWLYAASGKAYLAMETFETVQAAAEFAHEKLTKEAERLQKLQASLEKRKANVAKWEPKV